jgi:hypothetical protein
VLVLDVQIEQSCQSLAETLCEGPFGRFIDASEQNRAAAGTYAGNISFALGTDLAYVNQSGFLRCHYQTPLPQFVDGLWLRILLRRNFEKVVTFA